LHRWLFGQGATGGQDFYLFSGKILLIDGKNFSIVSIPIVVISGIFVPCRPTSRSGAVSFLKECIRRKCKIHFEEQRGTYDTDDEDQRVDNAIEHCGAGADSGIGLSWKSGCLGSGSGGGAGGGFSPASYTGATRLDAVGVDNDGTLIGEVKLDVDFAAPWARRGWNGWATVIG